MEGRKYKGGYLMSTLKYKTRGMSYPRGKQKVFFTSHPEDYDIYFQEISDLILKYQNCAIWYTEDGDAAEEDILDMQLYVIPVTHKFLHEENQAFSRDIGLAVANRIPVLPIMAEEGVELEFNRSCGNIQGIPLENRDATELPSEEKLKKFLNSVLVGDDLAAEIRKAFAAYIFMSYRKMDRKYAQDLMKLIHKNDECRDIAIWYDEFLTPGENFNKEIEGAMGKSALFALVITPNLINSQYIREIEYPKALEMNMAILPTQMASMEQNDWDVLSADDIFGQIDNIIEGSNHDVFRRGLLEAIKEIELKKIDVDNAKHEFLIGVAYLNGVDVEVNHETAVKLITKAAEAKYESAVKKLSDMYQYGEGVERNYNTSFEWIKELSKIQKKRAEAAEKDYEDGIISIETLKSIYIDLYDTYLDCDAKQIQAGKNIADCLVWAMCTVGNMARKGIAETDRQTIITVRVIERFLEIGETKDALEQMENAEEFIQKLSSLEETVDVKLLIFWTTCKLIIYWMDLEKIDRAKALCKNIPCLLDKMATENEIFFSSIECADGLHALGLAFEKLNEKASAIEYYDYEKVVLERISEVKPEMDLRKEISQNMASRAGVLDDHSMAKDIYETKLAYDLEWEKTTCSFSSKMALIKSYYYLGEIYECDKAYEQAKKYYFNMLKNVVALNKDQINNVRANYSDVLRERARVNLSLARIYYQTGDLRKAKGRIKRAKEVAEELNNNARTRSCGKKDNELILSEINAWNIKLTKK